MSKKIVAWHLKQVINVDKLQELELFAEAIEASVDLPYIEDNRIEEIEVSIFVENGDSVDIDILKAELEKIIETTPEIIPVYENDWQETCVQSFPPLDIGSFYIYSFEEACEDTNKISLKIPAQMAFGTGEHATTKGCLVLYENLKDDGVQFKNALDMGCGSAILSMAANKYEGVEVLGVDIDEPSVDVAKENLKINGIKSGVELIFADGFNDDTVNKKAPYDLIFANILKNPLLEMAEDLVNALDNGGFLILSGFKSEGQQDEIIEKYVNQLGLEWIDSFVEDGWAAITLVKSGN